MTNCHGNGKQPVAIRDGDIMHYFESASEAARHIGCHVSLITKKLCEERNTVIYKRYFVDVEETKRLRTFVNTQREICRQKTETIPVRDNGYTWNIKVEDMKEPKLLIAKYCGRLSVKKLAEITQKSAKEVRQLFDECLEDPAYEKYVRG